MALRVITFESQSASGWAALDAAAEKMTAWLQGQEDIHVLQMSTAMVRVDVSRSPIEGVITVLVEDSVPERGRGSSWLRTRGRTAADMADFDARR